MQGLPVSAGYTERRNTLRQKLAREKKEKEEMAVTAAVSDHSCGNCGVSPAGVTKRHVMKQEDFAPTNLLHTEQDIDALVDIIEGVKNVSLLQQHRNSSASESNDAKKAAKKARKREKKVRY